MHVFRKISLALLVAAPLFASTQALADGCYDCECSARGVWQAWDPEAVGTWAGGRQEPGINVRRCGEYNEGATSGVCTAGDVFNIYMNGAPAITGPRCELVITGGGGGGGGGDQGGGGNADDGVDRFASVLELFNADDAVQPAVEELGAWWNGRCYDYDRRSVARGGLLTLRTTTRDDGPLFPGDGEPHLYLFEHVDSATAFDELSADELSDINSLINDLGQLTSRASVVDGIFGSFYYPEGGTPVRWGVRKIQRDGRQYYISRATLARTSQGRAEGFVFKACYHYAESIVSP